MTIEWETPLSDGGSELLGYVVEKRLSTLSSTIKWSRVVTLDTYCLRYCIDNLKEKSEYVFRVLAENAIGLSAPAETENIVLKTHASKCLVLCAHTINLQAVNPILLFFDPFQPFHHRRQRHLKYAGLA